MSGPRETTFAEALDTLRSAAFMQGEVAALDDDHTSAKARERADRAYETALTLHAHEVERAKNDPPWTFGGDGTTTFSALVDALIEASSYANLCHVLAPNNEDPGRELAAARHQVFVALDEAIRAADADGYARAMGEVDAACELLADGAWNRSVSVSGGDGRWMAGSSKTRATDDLYRTFPVDAIFAAANSLAGHKKPEARP